MEFQANGMCGKRNVGQDASELDIPKRPFRISYATLLVLHDF